MVGTMLPWLSVVLPTMLGAFGSFQFVREGERAILLRFNKAVVKDDQYVVVEPGIKWVIPFADKLARTHMLHRTISLPSQDVRLANSEIYHVSVVILCEVKHGIKDSAQHLYNALFRTPDVNQSLIDYGRTVIQSTIASKSAGDLIGKLDVIAEELRENLQLQADEWGMQIISMKLTECSPTQMTQLLGTVRETIHEVVRPIVTTLTSHAAQPSTNGHHITVGHNGTGR